MAWFFRDEDTPITKARAERAMDGERCPVCGGRDISTSPDGSAFCCNAEGRDDDGSYADHCGCQWTIGDIFEVRADRGRRW